MPPRWRLRLAVALGMLATGSLVGAAQLTPAPPAVPPVTGSVYVGPNGDDSHSCETAASLETPRKTITAAARCLSAGGTLVALPGTYTANVSTSRSGTASARIRYVSSPARAAKIVGTAPSFVWHNTGSYVDIDGFEVTVVPGRNMQIGIYNQGSNVRLLNNYVHHIPVVGTGGSGGAGINSGNYSAQNVDMIGNVVHDIGNMSVNDPRVHGLYHAHPGGTIANNIVYRIQSYGIHLWHAGTDLTIANNLVFRAVYGGFLIGAGDSPGGIKADNCLIINNIAFDNVHFGIREYGRTGPSNRYINNLVFKNGINIELLTGRQLGTITTDPKFVNYKPDGSGDYRLSSGSPAIDKGASEGAPAVDIDGAARPQGLGVDIGPYER